MGSRHPAKPSEQGMTSLLTGLICFSSLIWSWEAIRSFGNMQKKEVFTAWIDFFYHASMIVQFAKASSTNVFEYGVAVPLYHYASYMLPAVLCSFADTPAIVVATANWCPFGFMLMGLGAWALGAFLAEWPGAILALVFLFLVPDSSHYGLKNSFFDFHWLLQISSGLSYGLGLCLLILGLFAAAITQRSRVTALFGAAMVLLEALFKMQLFALLLPVTCLVVICFWQCRPRIKIIAGACLISVAAVVSIVAERIQRAPHFWSSKHDVSQILAIMLDSQQSAIDHPVSHLMAMFPPFLSVLAGLALLLAAAGGLLLPAYALTLCYGIRRGKVSSRDFFPLVVVVIYCLIVIAFPTSGYNGSIEEYQHRNFVFVYAVLAIWVGALVARIASDFISSRKIQTWSLILFALLSFLPFVFSPFAQTGQMEWTRKNARVSVPSGLIASSEYIRRHAKPMTRVFRSDGADEDILIALSEHPAVLAFVRGVTYTKDLLDRRKAIDEQIERSRTYPEMEVVGRQLFVDYYVVSPGTILLDKITSRAVFADSGYYVFHF
jgi:hypothetical protein